MSKQLNVSLNFQANTQQAQQQIQSLQKALAQVAKLPASASNLFDDSSIKRASQSALELQQHLSKAVNVETGKLDLSRFSSSMKASNKDLQTYMTNLLAVGTTGQQAFLQLAQSIATADTPVTRINAKVAELGTTLKNTARWQISSSILHGFMGAVQSAYGYAQDLNESLTDIRIVTGASSEEMTRFAERANKAAKALSATTTEYTDAALIFYQQGLNDEEVQKRTDITIKMAHAAGESAESVSSYMTAIWNNFDDGTESLEYYGDVITKLGAATAASSEEIAAGLEKFASIGETVGLSYEYATAAVTTIVDKTRASADTVGTALKTIFARLQGLELGETLEDGVDLNKYSKALKAVGVEVLDLSGNLRNADDIIYDLGTTWDTLTRAQQTALAQTVAGTRQYTHLMSLMNEFDSFQQNVSLAENSEGTLQEQADIYADSWEGAQKRVQAAAENIYDSLINDEFFIDLLNGFEKVLQTIGSLIDGLGGMKGVITLVSSIFLTSFANKMPEALSNLRQNFMVFTGQASKEMTKVQDQLNLRLDLEMAKSQGDGQYSAQLEGIKAVNEMKQKLTLVSKNLTDQEKAEYEMKIKNVEEMYKEIAALEEKKKEQEKLLATSAKELNSSAKTNTKDLAKKYTTTTDNMTKYNQKIGELDAEAASLQPKGEGLILPDGVTQPDNSARLAQIEQEKQAYQQMLDQVTLDANELEEELTQVAEAFNIDATGMDSLIQNGSITKEVLAQMSEKAQEVAVKFSDMVSQRTDFDNLSVSVQGQAKSWAQSAAALQKYLTKTNDTKTVSKEINNMKQNMSNYVKQLNALAKEKGLTISNDQVKELLNNIGDLNSENMDSVIKEFQEFANTVDGQATAKVEELDNEIEELRSNMTDNMHFSPEAVKGLEKAAESSADTNGKIAALRENVKGFSDEAPKGAFQASVAMTQFGSAAMSASMLVSSWQSAMSVFTDENATGLEQLGAALSIVTAIMSTYNAVQALSTTLSKSDAIAKMGQAAGQAAANAMAAIGIGVKNAETGAVVANTAAWYANPIMWIGLIIVAVVAAVLLLVAAFKALADAMKMKDPGEQLKAAEAEASRLAEELDKAKEASDKLKSSIEGYDTAVKKIEELTEGTQEWRDAINEANDKAREIIEMGGMEGKYSFNASTGLIEFEDGALEDAQELADQQVKKVQAQKLMADNAVISAQQKVDTKDFVKGNGVSNKKETAAMEALYEAYEQAGGNFSQAMNSLSDEQKELLNGLDETKLELEKLCQASRDNTAAILANNKQIVDAQFSGTEAYDESSNKDFLNELMTEDMTAEAEKLYEEKYKDGEDYSDKEAQREYAKLMGWDENLVKNKSGNKAVYVNEEGEEVTISDAQVRQYLAQQEALENLNGSVDEYAKKVETLERKEDALAESYERGAISYEEYVKQMKAAGRELDLSSKQIESYIEKHADDSIKFSAKAQETMGLKSFEADALSNHISGAFEDNAIINSEEAMKIALDVAATSESLDDFARQFEVAVTDALIGSLETASTSVKTMMDTADENGGFSGADFDTLAEDETFTKWLEDNSMAMTDIISASYTEQYNIIARYYSDLTQMQYEAFEEQKENYQNDISEYQAIIDYKRALDEGAKADAAAVKEAWGDRIDFEAYADMDISELETKLDEAQAEIEELTEKKHEIIISWDGIDQLEKSFDEVGDFTSMMEKDAKKVGNSYQITAAQGKKWMEMYPELFSTASVTTDGLISLSEEEYEVFAAKEEKKRNDAIKTEIKNMKLRLEGLTEEEANIQTQMDLYTALAQGKVDLEIASAADLSAMRSNLVQFYIDSGLDEAAANAEALKQMGLSQEEYNKMVADSTENNSKNMTEGAKKGVDNIKKLFYNLITNLKNVFANLGNAIKSIFKGDWSSIGTYMTNAWNAAKGTVEGVKNDYQAIKGIPVDNYKIGNQYTGYANQAEFEAAKANHLQSTIDGLAAEKEKIKKEKAALASKITYLEASRNQDLDEYGSTDPDDVDETGDKKDKDKKDKDVQELLELTERYHEITREVAALEHQLELVGKAKERAFGSAKLAAMDKEIEALEKLKKKQEELYKAQLVYMAMDQTKVESAFSGVVFDEDGEISNYSDLVAQAAAELNAARTTYNNSGQTEDDKAKLEAAEKAYEDKTALLQQYEETVDKTRESEIALQDAMDNIQAAHAEKLSYEMELQVIVKDADLRRLEYYLSKTEDDFYKRAEGLALMNEQVGIYSNQLTTYQDSLNKWDSALASGDINSQQYIDGLNELQDGMYGDLEALQELDSQMMHYYEETLSAAQEEIDKTTSRLEKQTALLEHYMTILDLMGESTDYKKVGVILEGQAETTKNEMIAAKEEYLMFAKEAEEQYLLWQSATNEAEAELYKQQYEAALAASDEAQEEYLSKAEAYGESLKAILENSLNEYAQDLENALTGGTSFDQINTKLERAKSLQEEYLTTTNKIYETNKMMNTAQQEIDKSTNTVAKQKLKQFITETNELQKKNKLSQYELDIQQAKYELLLAEIALEEARDAKTTVRLQRDAEGNFGYVYTADQDKIAEAEQKLADAQNNLYNIGLDGAQDYMEKYQSVLSEMYDTFTDLQQQYLEGSFESEEEYQNAMAEAKEYYYQMLEDYSDLYTIAISTDAQVLQDSWTNEFQGMVDGTEDWKDDVSTYVSNVETAFGKWKKQMNELAGDLGVGGSLESLRKSVADVTKESEKLVDYTKNKVIPMAQAEIDAVEEVTRAYAAKRQELQEYIRSVEELNAKIDKTRKAAIDKPETTPPKPPSGGGGGSSGGGSGSSSSGGSGSSGGGSKTPTAGGKINAKGAQIYDYKGDTSGETQTFGYDPQYVVLKTDGDWVQVRHHSLSKGITGWFKKGDITALDTGGYTGSWGSYGKLAFLHEKELVLNQNDTQNLLDSMKLLDNIIQTIDLYTANSQMGGLLNSPAFRDIGSDTLEQIVTIEANFQGATSRTEIEEALSTLVNRASQYANRR